MCDVTHREIWMERSVKRLFYTYAESVLYSYVLIVTESRQMINNF
jgi:hypothetical protein